MKLFALALLSVQAAEELKGTPCTITGDFCTKKDCSSGCSSKTYALRKDGCVGINDKLFMKTSKCTEKDVEVAMFGSAGCAGQTTGKMLF